MDTSVYTHSGNQSVPQGLSIRSAPEPKIPGTPARLGKHRDCIALWGGFPGESQPSAVVARRGVDEDGVDGLDQRKVNVIDRKSIVT